VSRGALTVTDDTPSRRLEVGEIEIGDSVIQHVTFTAEMMRSFAAVANDRAPIHSNPDFARAAKFDAPIVQGLALSTRFSRLIGMYLPGEGAILEKLELKYRQPTYVGQSLIYCCVVSRVLRPARVVQLQLAIAADGNDHVTGQCQCLVR
jgi:3-hydroxybutyryl-CoA dehydratase